MTSNKPQNPSTSNTTPNDMSANTKGWKSPKLAAIVMAILLGNGQSPATASQEENTNVFPTEIQKELESLKKIPGNDMTETQWNRWEYLSNLHGKLQDLDIEAGKNKVAEQETQIQALLASIKGEVENPSKK